ncbi:SgcJ/EcaC family oxidoreductase [Mesorhizobium sp. M0152]|uniref:SgcJ/EcaC family oxidoreductase n=1 Tax=Mesorhizobium sp. M0152 TaxID=2956898 RepID=UPI000517D2A0
MKRFITVAVACVACAVAQGAQAKTSMSCKTVNKAQIAALFDRWNNSLETHDAAKVTANYAPDAVLLATVSNQPRTGPAAIKDYFVHFLERNPHGTIDSRTIHIGCNTAYDVGTYTFALSGSTPGTTETVKARYSYIYELRNGKWLIVHHHSSAMPEPVK